MLAFVCNQAVDFCGASASAFYRLDEETHLSGLIASSNLPTAIANIEAVTLTISLDSRLGNCNPLTIPNLRINNGQLLALFPGQSNWLDAVQCIFSGLLAIPLYIRGAMYGTLILFYSTAQDALPKQWVVTACLVADQAMLAVENSIIRTQAEQAAVSTERARLARDLHDSVTQTLFSASLIAEVVPRLWEKNATEGRNQLNELRTLTKSALAEMRGLLFELRPDALNKSPLPETLRYLVEGAAGRAGIPITFTTVGKTLLPPEIRAAFYRIAQETLNNIVKHANATSASVTLERHADKAELHISDNGRGFAPDAIAHHRFGLNIIGERAQAIGASLTVSSKLGEGTHIDVVWSYAQAMSTHK